MDTADEPRETFTDEELAFLRYVRFGELPARVPPDELTELTETDARRDMPDEIGDSRRWMEPGLY